MRINIHTFLMGLKITNNYNVFGQFILKSKACSIILNGKVYFSVILALSNSPKTKYMMITRVIIVKFIPVCLIETMYTNSGYT